MAFKSVWEELLSVIQRVERGDDYWPFWQPDRSHLEVVLSASLSSRDVERDLPSSYLEWSDIKKHWFYRGFVSKESEQESAIWIFSIKLTVLGWDKLGSTNFVREKNIVARNRPNV